MILYIPITVSQNWSFYLQNKMLLFTEILLTLNQDDLSV